MKNTQYLRKDSSAQNGQNGQQVYSIENQRGEKVVDAANAMVRFQLQPGN